MMFLSFHLLSRLLMFPNFGLAILDCATTMLALSQKDVVEGNPVWRLVMKFIGTGWMIPRLVWALASIYAVVHKPAVSDTWIGSVSLLLGCLVTGYAVWSNWTLYKKRKNANA